MAFLFYNPYRNEDIKTAGELEQSLNSQWKVYRQDITRQDLLYRSLNLEQTVSAAFYRNGKLLEVKNVF